MDEHEEMLQRLQEAIAEHLGTSDEERTIPDPEEQGPEFNKIRGMIGTYNNEGMLS